MELGEKMFRDILQIDNIANKNLFIIINSYRSSTSAFNPDMFTLNMCTCITDFQVRSNSSITFSG